MSQSVEVSGKCAVIASSLKKRDHGRVIRDGKQRETAGISEFERFAVRMAL
jgi:hypothetical protein